jgi:hypothetical protein
VSFSLSFSGLSSGLDSVKCIYKKVPLQKSQKNTTNIFFWRVGPSSSLVCGQAWNFFSRNFGNCWSKINVVVHLAHIKCTELKLAFLK